VPAHSVSPKPGPHKSEHAINHRHVSDRIAANAAACVAAVLFGASVVAVRIAVADVPPLTLALLRFGQGSLVLLAWLALFRRDQLRVARRDLPYLATLGLIFFTIFPYTFNAGLVYVPASRGALLVATMPLWTLVLARFAARDRPSARQIAGVLTSIAGVAIVMLSRGPAGGSMKGDALLLTTALCGAVYNLLAKRMLARYGGVTVTLYAMLFGSLFLLPLTLLERAPSFPSRTIAMVVFLGVFGGALGFALWTSALRRLSPTQVAVYINLNPMAATLLAATVLHEKLSATFVLGFLAVAAGVFVVNYVPRAGTPAYSKR
jgi:drug/metabolite transporter (DMT)-like permease